MAAEKPREVSQPPLPHEPKTPPQADPEPVDPHHTVQYVSLPVLISDEFGMPLSEAKMMLLTGIVNINGVTYERDDMFPSIPVEKVEGKTIEVTGNQRSVKFEYRPQDA